MSEKMKYIYVEVEERNGEREYRHRAVKQIPVSITDITKWADENYAGGMYGGDAPENFDGRWEYDGGEVSCELYKAEEITKEQYDVLFRFL
jgi:hypothetical protein